MRFFLFSFFDVFFTLIRKTAFSFLAKKKTGQNGQNSKKVKYCMSVQWFFIKKAKIDQKTYSQLAKKRQKTAIFSDSGCLEKTFYEVLRGLQAENRTKQLAWFFV